MHYWKKIERCPVCQKIYDFNNQKTNHHVLPKRFFKGIGDRYELCRKCHDRLERDIPRFQKLAHQTYYRILNRFIARHTPVGFPLTLVKQLL